MHLTEGDFSGMDSMFRRHFFNTLPGVRSVHLIGTQSHKGILNLGVFNSVCHISANPAHLGFVLRPLTVPRHTYHHLKAQGYFTLNTIHPSYLGAAHQTSANYDLQDSEFEATGLTPFFTDTHSAPYVEESPIKIGLEFVEEHHISVNDTLFIVGKVVEVIVPDEAVVESGHVQHEQLQTLGVAGLDAYHRVKLQQQMPYARPEKKE